MKRLRELREETSLAIGNFLTHWDAEFSVRRLDRDSHRPPPGQVPCRPVPTVLLFDTFLTSRWTANHLSSAKISIPSNRLRLQLQYSLIPVDYFSFRIETREDLESASPAFRKQSRQHHPNSPGHALVRRSSHQVAKASQLVVRISRSSTDAVPIRSNDLQTIVPVTEGLALPIQDKCSFQMIRSSFNSWGLRRGWPTLRLNRP